MLDFLSLNPSNESQSHSLFITRIVFCGFLIVYILTCGGLCYISDWWYSMCLYFWCLTVAAHIAHLDFSTCVGIYPKNAWAMHLCNVPLPSISRVFVHPEYSFTLNN